MITGIVSAGFIVLYYGLTAPIGWKQTNLESCINLYGKEWIKSEFICIEKL